jgi:hypothetical protein
MTRLDCCSHAAAFARRHSHVNWLRILQLLFAMKKAKLQHGCSNPNGIRGRP